MAVPGLIALCLVLLALRQSVILILLVAMGYVHLVWGDGMVAYLIEDLWTALDNPVLLTIPMFLMAGNLMARGSVARQLIQTVRAATDWAPGGLGLAAILSCALFAAISGSSPATLLAVGTVMYPALIQSGYDRRFALGAVTSAGTLGIIIPPSIPLILYGIVTETPITDLFLAAMLPGLLLATALGALAVWSNRHRPRGSFSLPRLLRALRQGLWSLMMPVLLLGGLYTGYFSPTEAAAVAVGYAVLVGLVIHRDLSLRDLLSAGRDTAQMLGTLFPIVAVALSLRTLMAIEGLPQDVADWLQSVSGSRIAFLLAVNAALLLVGCLIDAISAILLLAPILLVAAQGFGLHPVHFGIVIVLNLEIGLLTPPMGLNLLVATTTFQERFGRIARAVLPFVAVMLGVLLVVTFWPGLSLAVINR